jgi:hypothetical protein
VDEQGARRLIEDSDPSAAMRAVVSVATELDDLHAQVWAFGLADGARWAVAVVAQMGAELVVATTKLYEVERWYAGAALVRQLIEVEYLLFLFADDADEPERWMAASSDKIKQMFSPSVMRTRARGRLRATEYAAHCEMGGHPRRKGHILLRQHSVFAKGDPLAYLDRSTQWVDLAQHVDRLWSNYIGAITRHAPTNVYPERFARIDASLAAWRSADPHPGRI